MTRISRRRSRTSRKLSGSIRTLRLRIRDCQTLRCGPIAEPPTGNQPSLRLRTASRRALMTQCQRGLKNGTGEKQMAASNANLIVV